MNPEQSHGEGQDFVAPHNGGEKPKRRWWPFGRRREETPELADDPNAEDFDLTPHESVETEETEEEIPDWQQLQFSIQESDAAGWRDMELEKVYSSERKAKLGTFMDGERDFEVSEDGEIRRNGLSAIKETGRKMLASIVNKKNIGGAVALVAVGVATGGVGIPAIMTLAGGVIGRGVVEAWHSVNGEEKKLRQERASMSYRQFNILTEIATSIDEEGITEEERISRQEQLVHFYNESNKLLDEKTAEILHLKDNWNRKRNTGQFLGAIIGGVAGIAQQWTNLSEKALTMHLHGNPLDPSQLAHKVEKINGVWHYIYNTAQEAARAAQHGAHLVHSSAGYAAHAVGESGLGVAAEAAKNWLSGQAGQAIAVFGGMAVGRFFDRNDVKKESANLTESSAEKVVEMPERPVEPEPTNQSASQPVETGNEGGGGGSPEAGENSINVGEIWGIRGDDHQFRIDSMDPIEGTAMVTFLDENFAEIETKEMSLDYLSTDGEKRYDTLPPVAPVAQLPEETPENTAQPADNEPLEVTQEDLEEPDRIVVEEEPDPVFENGVVAPVLHKKYKVVNRALLPGDLKNNFPEFITFMGYGDGKKAMEFQYKYRGQEKTRNIMTERWPEISKAL